MNEYIVDHFLILLDNRNIFNENFFSFLSIYKEKVLGSEEITIFRFR